MRIPTHRAPTAPGEMLSEEFLIPLNISCKVLAEAIRVPPQNIQNILDGQASITPSLALRFSKYFNTSVGFWMNLQVHWDVYHAQRAEAATLAAIRPREIDSSVAEAVGK